MMEPWAPVMCPFDWVKDAQIDAETFFFFSPGYIHESIHESTRQYKRRQILDIDYIYLYIKD